MFVESHRTGLDPLEMSSHEKKIYIYIYFSLYKNCSSTDFYWWRRHKVSCPISLLPLWELPMPTGWKAVESQSKCGNIGKEINLCPCQISNTVCWILSPLRSHYINFVILALDEGEIFKSNFISCTNHRLCLLAASPRYAEVFARLNYSNTRATSFDFRISAFFLLYLCSAWHNIQQMLNRPSLEQTRTVCGGLVSEF